MFRKLILNKKGQHTAEYALLIALVVAAIIAMQTYAQRSLQGRIRDAGKYLTAQTGEIGSTDQYEPYYLDNDYTTSRDSTENVRLNNGIAGKDELTNRGRAGFESKTYTGVATP